MLADDTAALIDLATKGGGTFVGALGALGILWKIAIAPLASRLLDMHEKMANNVTDALRDHAAALLNISNRVEQIEDRIERYLVHREDQESRKP